MVNYTPPTGGIDDGMKLNTPVKEIMKRSFPSLDPEQEILEAVHLLEEEEVSGAVVLDKEKRPVGFLSEKDCLQLFFEIKYHNTPPQKIGDYMTKYVTCLSIDSTLDEAIDIFTRYYFHLVPVVDKEKVVGILERRAVLKAMDKLVQSTW